MMKSLKIMKNQKNKIKVGLIGAGYWGKNYLRVLNKLSVLEIVCDIDSKMLKERKRDFPKIKMTTEPSDVLKDKDTGAVIIATPADTHYSLAKKFLNAGKDVLVEKPFVFSSKQGRELMKLAEKKKRILMIDHLFLYHPALPKIKEIIKKGVLGKVFYLYSTRLNLGIIREKENALWSIAPHDISMILDIAGEMPMEVSAKGFKYLSKKNIDSASAVLRFGKNKTTAEFFVSWINPFKERRLSVIGSKGMLVFDDMAKDKLKIYGYEIKKTKNKETGYIRTDVLKKGESIVKISSQEPLDNLVRHFLECVKKRKTPKTDGIEACHVLKVLEVCEKSIYKSGASIKI
ncbi:MAG: Gfo/Idh/MocA family oxidoreductase [Candidatus Nealsonbacteria bacterium]|nr:Gfo/Idh/MocA family oxidoreductase [Candidatus Nealsonbacteria bacterium]